MALCRLPPLGEDFRHCQSFLPTLLGQRCSRACQTPCLQRERSPQRWQMTQSSNPSHHHSQQASVTASPMQCSLRQPTMLTHQTQRQQLLQKVKISSPRQRRTLVLMTTVWTSPSLQPCPALLSPCSLIMQQPVHHHCPAKALTQHLTCLQHQASLLMQLQSPPAFDRPPATACTVNRHLQWITLCHPLALLDLLLRCRAPLQPLLQWLTAPTAAFSSQALSLLHLVISQLAA